MAELRLKIPEKLKGEISKADWIDWSKVAAEAIAERLEDIKELELKMKAAEISEIPLNDKREVKKSLAKDVVRSTDEVLKEVKSGKRKHMTLEELDELMGLK